MLSKELKVKIASDMCAAYHPIFEKHKYLIWPLYDFWVERNRGGVKDTLSEISGFYEELESRRRMLHVRFGCTDEDFNEIVEGFLYGLHATILDEQWNGNEDDSAEELVIVLSQRAKYRLRPLFAGQSKLLNHFYKQISLGQKGLQKLRREYPYMCKRFEEEVYATWQAFKYDEALVREANQIVTVGLHLLYEEKEAKKPVKVKKATKDRSYYTTGDSGIMPAIAEIMVRMRPVFENRYDDLELLVKSLLVDDMVQANQVMSRDEIGLSVGAEIKRVMKDHKCSPDDAVVYVSNALRFLRDKMNEECR